MSISPMASTNRAFIVIPAIQATTFSGSKVARIYPECVMIFLTTLQKRGFFLIQTDGTDSILFSNRSPVPGFPFTPGKADGYKSWLSSQTDDPATPAQFGYHNRLPGDARQMNGEMCVRVPALRSPLS